MWERSSSPYLGLSVRLRHFTFAAVRKGSFLVPPRAERAFNTVLRPPQNDELTGSYLNPATLQPALKNGQVRAYDTARGIVRVSREQEKAQALMMAALTRSAILLARIV